METIKVSQQINDIPGENIIKLNQLFPGVVKDGEVDFKRLKEYLGDFTEVGNEKYELTWAGKKETKKLVQEDIYGKTLKYCEEKSRNSEITENLYIEGDNLEILKLLRQNYYGAIKMIYIDPPYNTGNDFVYNDSFEMSEKEAKVADELIDDYNDRLQVNTKSQNRYHAKWMNMMYARLAIAKDLLQDDGVIFMSIDDCEVDNLKKIGTEIFGDNNFIADLIWQKKFSRANDATYFSTMHDHILCFCKNNITNSDNGWRIGLLPRGEEIPAGYSNPDNDPRGVWTSVILSAKSGSESLLYEITTPSGRVVTPPSGRYWSCSKETFEKWKNDNRIWFGKDGDGTPRKKTFLSEVQDGLRPNTILFQDEAGNNQEAKQETKQLFDGVGVFDGPKPVRLIKLLETIANLDDDSIVLDFFSGSATTAHAVMEYNAENDKHVKYIMTQIPEKCDETTEAYKNGFLDICQIGEERIRRAAEYVEKNYAGISIDTGFKVFYVSDTNIKWNSLVKDGQLDLTQIESTPDMMDFMPGTNDIDVVYEIMLRQRDVPLSEHIEKLSDIGERTYLYADAYLICLETEISKEMIDKMAAIDPVPVKYVFRDSAFKDDIALKDETFRRLKAVVEKNTNQTKQTYTVEFI
ncbi:MAG: site-specific DNA-methyltransferase [Lachnospira sp.]|nr:site-specific DNA-methyltransferase [Lachnospira sp.]